VTARGCAVARASCHSLDEQRSPPRRATRTRPKVKLIVVRPALTSLGSYEPPAAHFFAEGQAPSVVRPALKGVGTFFVRQRKYEVNRGRLHRMTSDVVNDIRNGLWKLVPGRALYLSSRPVCAASYATLNPPCAACPYA